MYTLYIYIYIYIYTYMFTPDEDARDASACRGGGRPATD